MDYQINEAAAFEADRITSISFGDESGPVGRLHIVDGKLDFTGDVTESAKAFVKEVERLWAIHRDLSASFRDGSIDIEGGRIEHLTNALDRIATPAAFYVATSKIDPEAFGRMIYAKAIIEGHTLESANNKAEFETLKRYPLRT